MKYSRYICDDLNRISKMNCIPWEKLRNKTVLITGGTGLIGTALIQVLFFCGNKWELNINICLIVRDIDDAKNKLKPWIDSYKNITFYKGEVESKIDIDKDIDYIIHGASPTDSAFFIKNPVETIKTAVFGTFNMLGMAVEKHVEGFIYLSSMEVYGESGTEDKLSEIDLGYMNPLNIRNCYPESKKMCESLMTSFVEEYGVHARGIRLAQTFGPGIKKNDKRVFAEFARCVIDRNDIKLLTDGSSKRCYLYTMEAVSAILVILLKGEDGQVYNAANTNTYCSIKEMADMVVREFGHGDIDVKFINDKKESKKFSPPHFYNLDTTKLEQMGWNANIGLKDMYERMLEDMLDEL